MVVGLSAFFSSDSISRVSVAWLFVNPSVDPCTCTMCTGNAFGLLGFVSVMVMHRAALHV